MSDLETASRTEAAPRIAGRPPSPARKVRLPWLAGAGGIALLTALVVLWGFGQVGDRREVVMVVSPVAEGQEIAASDLGSTQIAVDSPSTQLFSIDQRDELVGRVAAVDLAVGDLLGPSSIATATAVPDGWVEVGAFVRGTRYPASMATGDQMRAIDLDPDEAVPAGTEDGVLVEVVSIRRGDDRDVLAVLAVPADSAPTVARWASGDSLVLLKVDQP